MMSTYPKLPKTNNKGSDHFGKYLLKPGKRRKPVLGGRQKAFAVGRIGYLGEEGGVPKGPFGNAQKMESKIQS